MPTCEQAGGLLVMYSEPTLSYEKKGLVTNIPLGQVSKFLPPLLNTLHVDPLEFMEV